MHLNGYEKSAILLSFLGEETAAEVLKNVDVEAIGKITTCMTRMKSVKRPLSDDVLKEALDRISDGDLHIGGEEFIKKALSMGLGEDNAIKILEIASKEAPIDALKWVDSKTLTSFLVAEHPQTLALIISLLEPVKAAEVLASLNDSIKTDVAIRIATTERIPKSAIEELNEVLKGHLDIGKGEGKKLAGTKTIAEILNQCDRTTEKMVLEKIEEQDSVLADSIRQLMFVFDDLIKVDDRGIQAILKETSTEDLTLALKTAPEALKDKIFKNMSQRAAQILKEEIQVKGPVRVSDVEKAQQSIVRVTRRLEEEGKILLTGKGSESFVE